ncbi:unnamed protein product [Hydatigera taeniaeformis]|uniref:Homeobox domain-containing protein n=1 Tax=Hydatigena taeniaeformis TaxID=6205 RepID=A0A0R3WY46_HYDTA|nr:unnamed protein product [Hydatigera taeniaeformis]
MPVVIWTPGPSRRRRTNYRPHELEVLEAAFRATRNPDRLTRQELANRLGTNERRIQVWFKNRRAKLRRLPQ